MVDRHSNPCDSCGTRQMREIRIIELTNALRGLALYVARSIAIREDAIRAIMGDDDVDAIQDKAANAIRLANGESVSV